MAKFYSQFEGFCYTELHRGDTESHRVLKKFDFFGLLC